MRTTATALSLVAALAAPATAQVIDTLAIRGHTRFLADDLLEGRGTGTAGERIAAAYIASQLERLGLRGLGGDRIFHQPIPLRAARIDENSRITIHAPGDSAHFDSGIGFVMSTGGHGAFRDFRGRAIHLGAPAHALPRIRSERSLVGRVAVFSEPLGTHAIDIIPALSHAGAAGIILLVDDDETFDLYLRSRGELRYFVEAAVDDPVWQPPLPVVIAGPAMSATLLQGIDFADDFTDGTGEEAVDLGRTIVARIRAITRDVPAANVAAVLPGSDPVLRDEYVVYTAHYDHLGIGPADARGDSIYNGFSDNAAGVAMLLAIAETLRERPPPRSVLFLFFTGEERGLLGSTFFAATSPVPPDRMVGVINLDAGAPPVPPVSWRIAGGTDWPLGDRVRDIAGQRGWTASLSAATPNSDYWPFHMRGVPSVFIIPGDQWENTTPVERDALRRLWDRYHRPDDHWHPDFPFAGLGRYAEFALLVGLDIAGER